MRYDTERFAEGCVMLGRILLLILMLWGAYCLLIHEGIAEAWIRNWRGW